MQGGIGPSDWLAQMELSRSFPNRIGLCFGLHPYWVAGHSQDACEQAMDLLASSSLQNGALALGEMGLDFRFKILNSQAADTTDSSNLVQVESQSLDPEALAARKEHQIDFFEAQLEIAELTNLPVVLHLVQAFDEAIRILDIWGLPKKGGIVHSFNGNWSQARAFLDRDLYLSLGGPLTHPRNKNLRSAAALIPLERVLIESDAPDQAPYMYPGGLNRPTSIQMVAGELAILRNKGETIDDLLHIATNNVKRVFLNGESYEQ